MVFLASSAVSTTIKVMIVGVLALKSDLYDPTLFGYFDLYDFFLSFHGSEMTLGGDISTDIL